jgi:hypothetical protein
MPRPLPLLLGVLMLALPACSGLRAPDAAEDLPPDERFGHRYEGDAPDRRETMLLQPLEPGVEAFSYPVYLDTVVVRVPHPQTAAAAEAGVPVEVLLKGAIPDGCSSLGEVRQERNVNLLNVTLEMRRPKGAYCTQVVRPFRFYLTLDGRYTPGHYTLKVNDLVQPFQVFAPRSPNDD